MKTLILIIEEKSDWSPQNWFEIKDDCFAKTDRLSYESDSGWIAATHDDRLFQEFDDDELIKIREVFDNPVFYLIEGNSTSLLIEFFLSIPKNALALVDNDHGQILPSYDVTLDFLNPLSESPKHLT